MYICRAAKMSQCEALTLKNTRCRSKVAAGQTDCGRHVQKALCASITPDGTRCKYKARTISDQHCFQHTTQRGRCSAIDPVCMNQATYRGRCYLHRQRTLLDYFEAAQEELPRTVQTGTSLEVSLQEQLERLQVEVRCVICLTERKCVKTDPCKHVVMCCKCALTVVSNTRRECPVCKAFIAATEVLYI